MRTLTSAPPSPSLIMSDISTIPFSSKCTALRNKVVIPKKKLNFSTTLAKRDGAHAQKQATQAWSLLDQGDGDSARSHHCLDLFAHAAQELMWQDKDQNVGIACCADNIGVGYDICRQFDPRHVLHVLVLLSVEGIVTKTSCAKVCGVVCGQQAVLFLKRMK
jgi:hypothetical protein